MTVGHSTASSSSLSRCPADTEGFKRVERGGTRRVRGVRTCLRCRTIFIRPFGKLRSVPKMKLQCYTIGIGVAISSLSESTKGWLGTRTGNLPQATFQALPLHPSSNRVLWPNKRLKAGLHVRRKHKHRPRVNRDDANTSARKSRSAFLFLALVSSRFTRGLCLCLCVCVCLRRTCKPVFSDTPGDRLHQPLV